MGRIFEKNGGYSIHTRDGYEKQAFGYVGPASGLPAYFSSNPVVYLTGWTVNEVIDDLKESGLWPSDDADSDSAPVKPTESRDFEVFDTCAFGKYWRHKSGVACLLPHDVKKTVENESSDGMRGGSREVAFAVTEEYVRFHFEHFNSEWRPYSYQYDPAFRRSFVVFQ